MNVCRIVARFMITVILCVSVVSAHAHGGAQSSSSGVRPELCRDVFLETTNKSTDFSGAHARKKAFDYTVALELELAAALQILPKAHAKELKKAFEKLKASRLEVSHLHEWGTLLRSAVEQLPKIRLFIDKSSRLQRKYFVLIYAASLSAVIKFPQVYFKNHSGERDWARYAKILKSVTDFNAETGKFSLYKIKRSIEGRYSMREFIRCRQ